MDKDVSKDEQAKVLTGRIFTKYLRIMEEEDKENMKPDMVEKKSNNQKINI